MEHAALIVRLVEKLPDIDALAANVTTSLAAVIGVGRSTDAETERRLHGFVVPFLQALDRAL